MGSQSFVLADKDVIFMMDLEELFRSNGFSDLSIETAVTDKELMKSVPKLRPDWLVLGDLECDFKAMEASDPRKIPSFSPNQFVDELIATIPDMHVINVGASQLTQEDSLNNPVKTFTKPVDNKAVLSFVEEQIE